ncbi:V-type ATP synthase subunit I [Flavonifractor sp. An112]|uniref:V-type ATP synthase subunit I n=1 Tax=Flavonifractor sp. An112 TaxID=1965544 RepID=UPI00174E6F8C|nr:V-type ATP synthase subunit I [Flavonifractor sp. An112]HIZ93306.1 V-type ATP synthase subunit I [Candidatus Flavonifractor avicola]
MSIVKMKRLRLIGMQSERESMLRLLQHLGCVEIDEPGDRKDDPDWASLTRPDTGALNEARDARSSVENALKALKKYGPKQKGGLLTPRPVITEGELFDDAAYRTGLADAGQLVALERKISALYAEQNKLRTQKLALAPWLALDIPLETASTPEVAVSFGTVAASTDLDAMDGALGAVTDLYELMRAGADNELKYLVFLCHRSAEEDCQAVLKEYGFSRAALRGWTGTAAENDKRLDEQLADAARELESTIAQVGEYASKKGALEQCLDRADQEIAREEARCRLLDSSSAFFLEGWVPVPDEKKLLEQLGQYTCCWETQDPAPEDYPVVPVKLKNNKLTEPLTTITEMYSLPAYDGVDPNGLMMPFYVFFFGFMFADLGYGLILAGACAFINHKVHPKGGFGQLIRLMIMCGISSAVIGFFTGGFFSDFLAQFTSMLGLSQPVIPFLSVPDGVTGVPGPLLNVMGDPMTVLVFALAVGFVQIVVGMAVKFWMLCRRGQVVDAILDIGTWWVIFVGIGLFAAGIGNVAGYPVVLIIGCLMLLGQGRTAKGFGKVTAIIGAVYNGVTGYFGDILSYSRLMVMMLAGSVIGQVFNILGAMPGGGMPPAIGIPIFFIIFIIGHAFNIGLNVIGTYVHTSRLQYLEFFKQFYEEGGRPWRPLNIATKYVDIKEEE